MRCPRPEKDLPDHRLPPLPVAAEKLDVIFPQRRVCRSADLFHVLSQTRSPPILAPTLDRRRLWPRHSLKGFWVTGSVGQGCNRRQPGVQMEKIDRPTTQTNFRY